MPKPKMPYSKYADARTQHEAWLDTQPYDIVSVYVARQALRALPSHIKKIDQVAKYDRPDRAAVWETYILPIFRAIATTLYAGIWPSRAMKLPMIEVAERIGKPISHKYDLPEATYYAASAAACPVVYYENQRAGRAAAATFATYSVAHATSNIYWSTRHGSPDPYGKGSFFSFFTPYSWEDIEFVKSGGTAIDLALQGLWPPDFEFESHAIGQHWSKLKSHLFLLNQEWEVWTDWYEDRLNTTSTMPFNEMTEIGGEIEKGEFGRVTLPLEMYDDPASANFEIKKMIDKACSL